MEKLSNELYYPASIAYVTAAGNPAIVDDPPVWDTTDSTVFVVANVSADGLSAEIHTVDGADGVAELVITADADLGDGVKPIETRIGIEVRPGEAVAGSVTFGAGVPKIAI